MVENHANSKLTINGYTTYYRESARGAEVDYIIQKDGKISPIEVKSADNIKAKSLKMVRRPFRCILRFASEMWQKKVTKKYYGEPERKHRSII